MVGGIPPPCVACADPAAGLGTTHSCMSLTSSMTQSATNNAIASSLRTVSPEPLPFQSASHYSPVSDEPKVQRHKSVSRRVLSSLKSNLSSAASRTRGAQSIRPVDSETSLLKKDSGSRKPDPQPPAERRAYSFDVSRESVASEIEPDADIDTDPVLYSRATSAHRSFTDSTVSTSALVEELGVTLPPPGTPTPDRVALNYRHSAVAPSPPPKYPATFDLTPRRQDERLPRVPAAFIGEQLIIPYIKLHVTVDSPALDVRTTGNVWVAIEASVQMQTVNLPTPTS